MSRTEAQLTSSEIIAVEELNSVANSKLVYKDGTGVVTGVGVGTGLAISGGNLNSTTNGDVVGPASSTDNAIARFDLTTGKLIQNSGATIDDSGNLTANNFSGTSSGTNTGDQTNISGNAGTATALQTPRTIAGVSFDGTANIDIALDNLSDVVITTPVLDEILRYNGSGWANSAQQNISAGQGVILFPDDSISVTTLRTLETAPDGTAEVDETAIVSTAGTTTAFAHTFASAPIGGSQIDAGVWDFDDYTYVSNAGDVVVLTHQILKRVEASGTVTITGTGTSRTATASTGTPFVSGDANADKTLSGYLETPTGIFQITGFTSGTVVTIETDVGYVNESAVAFSVQKNLFYVDSSEVNQTTVGLQSIQTVQPAFTGITATDRIVLRNYAKKVSGNTARTLHFVHNGSTHYSHFHTPLITRHNDLAGIQGGAANDAYHLTSAQHTIATQASSTSQSGYLTSTDWNTFNGKASSTLNNLGTTAINTTLASDTDNTDDLGTTIKKWANLFVTTIGATATRVTKGWFTDIESTNIPTVGGTAMLTSLTAPQFTTIELGHATDTTISRVSAGKIAVEGINVVTTSSTDTLTNKSIGAGVLQLEENASIALDPAGSADGKYSGITISGTAGATLAFGDVIVLDVTASKWLLADANSAASADGDARGLIGMCVLAANDTQTTKILLNGTCRADANFPALTITAPVYLSETAGDIVVAQPTTTDAVIRVLGFALTADEIYFNPSSDYITHV